MQESRNEKNASIENIYFKSPSDSLVCRGILYINKNDNSSKMIKKRAIIGESETRLHLSLCTGPSEYIRKNKMSRGEKIN